MYEIKVLNSNDFDAVAKSDSRYEYVDKSNLGFADRLKGVCYVRDTEVHDLNKYLIDHELEELEQDESTHEDPNGIRHKKFWDFIRPFFNVFTDAAKYSNPISMFMGSGQQNQQQQQEQPQSGTYTPQSPTSGSSQAGGFNSPLNLFSGEPTSGSYSVGSQYPGSVSGLNNTDGNLSNKPLSQEEKYKQAGYFNF